MALHLTQDRLFHGLSENNLIFPQRFAWICRESFEMFTCLRFPAAIFQKCWHSRSALSKIEGRLCRCFEGMCSWQISSAVLLRQCVAHSASLSKHWITRIPVLHVLQLFLQDKLNFLSESMQTGHSPASYSKAKTHQMSQKVMWNEAETLKNCHQIKISFESSSVVNCQFTPTHLVQILIAKIKTVIGVQWCLWNSLFKDLRKIVYVIYVYFIE